jgi:hypothetical protein
VGRGRRSTGGLPLGTRLGARGGVVEGQCWGGSLEGHGELLEEKLIPHGMEGGEGIVLLIRAFRWP